MTERWKNILIGTFVAAALSIVVAFVLFLKPTVGDGHKLLKARFTNIAGINKGTRVTYAGKPVGDVVSIQEVPNARLEPDDLGRIFTFQLTMRVDSATSVFTTDEISIRTTGLMGERLIAIVPKSPAQGKLLQPVSNEILYANSIDPFDNTLNHMARVASRAESSFALFDTWFQQTAPALLSSTVGLTEATRSLMALLNEVKDLNLAGSLSNSLNHFSDILRQVRDENVVSNLGTLIKNAGASVSSMNGDGSDLIGNLKQLTGDLTKGTGTFSRFIKGDDFYLRLNSLMSKSETLMNDINHYGILFQYNKQWQRMRTKKIHLLNALDTPQDFKTYFEGEIDSINTSLGRIGSLLERAEEDPEREKIVRSDPFKRDFAILLRQVQALNETLKLYNQDLVAKSEAVD